MPSTIPSIPLHHNDHYQIRLCELPQPWMVMPTNYHGATTTWAEGAYPATDIGGSDFPLPEADYLLSAPLLSSFCPELFQWKTMSLPTLSDTNAYSCSQPLDCCTHCQPPATPQRDTTMECSEQRYVPTHSKSWEGNWGTRDLGIAVKSTASMKVGKYSAEERRVRILRYLKKRNHRNFNKTIKYACRKALADRRTRVRGRFIKNCEQEMIMKSDSSSPDNEGVLYPYGFSEQTRPDGDGWLQDAIARLMYIPRNILAEQENEFLLK